MLHWLLTACLVTVAFASVIIKTDDETDEAHWKLWKAFYNKTYEKYEDSYRRAIWIANYQRIIDHNKGEHSFSLAMNELGDLTLAEYQFYMCGARYPGNKTHNGASTFMAPSNIDLPTTVDWRNEGYVTPVKNQGQCGSCYAFSSTGSLEGQHFKKTGNLVSLSEQNIVDCTQSYGNQGCNGGWMDNAFKYIRDNNGIDTETGYPYYARALGYCYFRKDYVGATDTGFMDITKNSESDLQVAVATVGPISVAIDAAHQSFQLYRSGVYYEPTCSTTKLDHAVLVVGYGTYNGQDYWLVKNSWGTSWGMNGYIMMARNRDNHCGIATAASYPLV